MYWNYGHHQPVRSTGYAYIAQIIGLSKLSLEKYDSLYAFQYKPNIEGYLRSRGWNLYDSAVEFSRMGVPNEHWTFTDLNKNYEVRNLEIRKYLICLIRM